MAAPPVCPVCGEDGLSPNMAACPNCGACEKSGWSDEDEIDVGALGIDDFDYESFVEDEFGSRPDGVTKPKIGWLWWGVAVLLLVGMTLSLGGC